MPYRHAWLFILALIGATVVAFWRGYLSRLGASPMAFHLHGTTAGFWMMLLAFQSWNIHGRSRALHKAAGLAIFAAVPLFFLGSVAVLQTMAQATAGGRDPFYAIYGERLGAYDLIAATAFGWLVWMALATRRNVQLHSRYMLATSLLLLGPVVGRVINRVVPGLVISSPADFHLFAWGIHLSTAVAVGIAAWLYLSNRRFGRPWLIAGGACLLESIVFETLAKTAVWERVFTSLAPVSTSGLYAAGLLVGAAIVWFSWKATPPLRPAPVAT
ncbi:MAG: hypothetical protein ACT6RD_08795 [Brevundimonas sp.]|uniref:hypothetical protein n=1 Tax=Brevundimonas sp. TaxID=1871086 RepID=UPI0040333E49